MPVSTFYDRVGWPASAGALADAELAERIEKIWSASAPWLEDHLRTARADDAGS